MSLPNSTGEVDQPDEATAAAVLELSRAAAAADGHRPFSEQTVLRLTGAHPGVRHFLVDAACSTDGALPELAGYAQLDASGAAELAVDPAHRRRGHGRTLLRRLLSAGGPGGLRVWSHAGHPGAAALAESAGLVVVRELWQMRRSLPVEAAAGVALPDGLTVRTYAGDADADAWVALNALAFAAHGEQGRLQRRDFDDRAAQPWFDPKGLFLAERPGPDGQRRLVGFHWTKVHAAEDAGEIYVLGVDPAEQGSGLGRALAALGLSYLASLGLPEVFLYVDAANAPAVRVYERLGFVRTETHVMYGTP